MKILVVIDMQNDFISGVLGTKEAMEIVPKVIKKIQDWDDCIYATRDTHTNNYLNTQEGQKLPIVHCVLNTEGWAIQNEVAKALKDREVNEETNIINKPIFGSYQLAMILQDLAIRGNLEEVHLIGLCTDICVISNAMTLKSFLPLDTRIVVDASCCAGVTPESHKTALEAMKMCQIEIINEE